MDAFGICTVERRPSLAWLHKFCARWGRGSLKLSMPSGNIASGSSCTSCWNGIFHILLFDLAFTFFVCSSESEWLIRASKYKLKIAPHYLGCSSRQSGLFLIRGIERARPRRISFYCTACACEASGVAIHKGYSTPGIQCNCTLGHLDNTQAS